MRGGLLLIAAALLLAGYNLWDDRRAGLAASQALEQLLEREAGEREAGPGQEGGLGTGAYGSGVQGSGEEEIPDYLLDPGMEMPTESIDGKDYIGTLELPALDLSLPVISRWNYPDLRVAPCRYAGSAYTGDLVIAAHNYQRHFGSLDSLAPGDPVWFTDVDGNRFTYEVAEIQVLQPTDIEEMVESGWDLTLFTCTLGGKTRVTVRCEEKTESDDQTGRN